MIDVHILILSNENTLYWQSKLKQRKHDVQYETKINFTVSYFYLFILPNSTIFPLVGHLYNRNRNPALICVSE